MWDSILDASAWVIPVITAIILHEVAHGWMAERYGDPTARMLGRITLNPLKHIDRFGTILFPAILIAAGAPLIFGYAKPVPVDFRQLNPPRKGMFMVALAGPAINVLIALFCGLLLHIDLLVTPEQAPWIFQNLYRAIIINCGLAVFNMLPMLPLDGGRVLYSFLQGRLRELFGRTERYGMLLLFTILLLPWFLGYDINEALGIPVFTLVKAVLLVTGNSH